MKLHLLFSSTIFGFLIGVLWAFALDIPVSSGMFYGSVFGALSGLTMLQRHLARSHSSHPDEDFSNVDDSLFNVLFVVAALLGCFVWYTRVFMF